MAQLSKQSRIFERPIFWETITSDPAQYPLDPAFDSKLEAPAGPGQNWTLRLTLKMLYSRMTPQHVLGAPVALATAVVRDANGTPSLIKDWTAAEWIRFVSAAQTQASHWDSKFWLIPPAGAPWFDIIDQHGARNRPNVKCEFELLVVPTERFPHHRLITVYNLATNNPFRSHNAMYDSDDVKNQTLKADQDRTGTIVQTNQWTVTHETGHALGLSHVGVLRNDPSCGLAVLLEKTNRSLPAPIPVLANQRGGTNSVVCYGPGTTADAIRNIMGQGMTFTAEDAQPWLDRLFEHVELSGQDSFVFHADKAKWTVSVGAPMPPRIIR